MEARATLNLPDWVTPSSLRYLAHTEAGRSIRDLARSEACHPSTILRQIRRVETRRDDPLVDEALDQLGQFVAPDQDGLRRAASGQTSHPLSEDTTMHTLSADQESCLPTDTELAREAPRILRRLCETGAVLALAADMDKAVVVRDGTDGSSTRTAVVERGVAQAMALNDWISCQSTGRIARYVVTPAGRSALGEMLAAQENRELQRAGTDPAGGPAEPATLVSARGGRTVLAESPLVALARRRTRDGAPFLEEDLVNAGERLREDFELAQIDGAVLTAWERLLTTGVRGTPVAGLPQTGINAAQDRVLAALADLGPGLGDVALRCCCFLQGLEQAERHLGWSARSGKIVLRIALQRLLRHYGAQGAEALMIG